MLWSYRELKLILLSEREMRKKQRATHAGNLLQVLRVHPNKSFQYKWRISIQKIVAFKKKSSKNTNNYLRNQSRIRMKFYKFCNFVCCVYQGLWILLSNKQSSRIMHMYRVFKILCSNVIFYICNCVELNMIYSYDSIILQNKNIIN